MSNDRYKRRSGSDIVDWESQKLAGDFFYRIIDKIFDDRCPALPTVEARPTDEWQPAAAIYLAASPKVACHL
jgi:hypothetical protein